MKKVISWILTIALLFSLMPAGTFTLTAEAATVASGICGTNLTWTLDSAGTLTISGTGRMIDYAYEDTWYNYLDKVKTVVVGDSVTNIGIFAFTDCVNLTKVTIGKNVSSIGDFAFSYCSNLKSVSIPSKVSYIGEGAFIFCENLTAITVESTNKYFVSENGILFNKDKTELVSYPAGKEGAYTIPSSVTSIGVDAFRSCTKLTDVVIPEGVKNIGDGAFSGCTSLTQVEIPNYVTNIGWFAFEFCTSLTKLTIGECVASDGSTTGIGRQAFNYTNLKDIYFEGRSPVINENAFPGVTATAYYYPDETWTEDVRQNYGGTITWVPRADASKDLVFALNGDQTYTVMGLHPDCTNTEIVIPATYMGKPVVAVGDEAFMHNTTIASVVIPDSVTSIGKYAFYQCSALKSVTIGNGVKTIGESAFYDCDSLTSVTLGNRVETIDDFAFSACNSLPSVTIPASVTSLGQNAFYPCTTGIWVSSGNVNYSSDESGVLFNKNKTTLIQAPSGLSGTYIIPDSVTSIRDSAFYGCTGLTSLTIGSGVKGIGMYSFGSCTGLTSVTIPDSVKEIDGYAFYGCTGLTSITFGSSVQTIGQEAFSGCTRLKEIHFEGSAPAIGAYAFNPVTATAYYYPDETWTASVMQNYGIGTITWVARTKATQGLIFTLSSDGTYYSVTGLEDSCTDTDIVIPDTYEGKPVKAIGNNAFKNKKNITSVKIPDSVTSIGNYAFAFCSSLNGELIIPDSVVSIGQFAFVNCTKLTLVTIGNGVKTIGYSAFVFCSGLTGELVIPDSVISIGDFAFQCCSGLTSVSIPASIAGIGVSAFRECTSLTGIWVSTGNAQYSSDESGVLFNKGKTTLIQAPGGISGSYIIPNSVTSIGDGAFYYCTRLKEISFEGSAPKIANNQFFCVKATAYYYPDETWTEDVRQNYGGNITWVARERASEGLDFDISDDGTYYIVTGIGSCKDTDIVIPSIYLGKPVKAIGSKAFMGNTNIVSAKIPDSVTNVGEQAFEDCTRLASVAIENGVETIGIRAFYRTGLTGELIIPDSVISIGDVAFAGCDGLTSVIIPSGVTEIGERAFNVNDNLTGIWVDDGNANYSNDEYGILFNKDKTILIQAPGALSGHYKIPDNIVIVGNYAFGYCADLTSVTIGNNVEIIGDSAFMYCTGLTGDLTIPDSVISIGYSAFGHCTVLISVTIGNNVEIIDDCAFDGCAGLTSVTIGSNVETIGRYAFRNCVGLTSVTIPGSVKTIGDWTFSKCTAIKEIYFEGPAPTIGSNTFVKNTFQDVTATAYYYPDETWTSSVMQNYGGTITWVALSKCEHDFTDWMPIELDGVTYRIRACKKCGYIETDLPDNVAHLHDWQWESKDPTCTEPGYKDYIWCNNCDLAVSKILIDPLGHDESGDWVQGTDKHWKICQRPECSDKILEADHSHGQWVEDTPAKCETAGTKHRTCECGHIEYGTDPKLGHDDSDAWHYDANGHWKICQRPECGETILLANHQHNRLVGSVPATCTEQGYNIYACKCEHTENRDFNGPLEHIPGSWQYNRTHHWKTCQRENCGAELEKAEHTLKTKKVEVTCTTDGYTTYSCDCGYTDTRDVEPAPGHDDSGEWYNNDDQHWKICDRDNCDEKILKAGHSYGNWVVDTEAKCETAGSKHRTCTTCGYIHREEITKLDHIQSGVWHYDANGHWKICQRPGCGEKILAVDHSLQKGKVTDPTCTEQGYTTYHCVCGYSVKKDFTDAKIHDESGEWLYNDTQHWKICQRPECGETILRANHQHNKLVDSVSATCTEQGYSIYACQCGHTENRDFNGPLEHIPGSWQYNRTHHWKTCQRENCGAELEKAEHTLKTKKVEVTCTTDGYTTDYCDCGHANTHDVVTAPGHDESGDWVQGTDKHWKICQRENCGAKILETVHSYGNWVVDTEAKCETAGSKHHTCTTCGYIHREEITKLDHIQSGVWHYDANGHWKICQRPGCGVKILAADHSLQKGKVTDPTCTEQGYTTYHCVCGYSVKKDFTDAKIHDDSGKWLYNDTQHWKICQRPECGKTILLENHKFTTVKVDATCTEQGYTTYSCNCGYTDKREEVTIPGHDYDGAWYYDANGHWKICQRSGCNEKLLTADHSYGDWVVDTAAKCETDGSKHRTCTTCGYVQREVIPAPGHDDSGSWQHNDSKHWKVCGECGENIQTSNHSYGNWITDVAAECEKDGSKHRDCMCGYTEYGIITKLGHDHSGSWQKDESGHWKICDRDNCDKILDQSGHNYGEYILKTDKSTQNGITVFTHYVVSECEKCGYEWSSDSTDVHIHERVTVIHSVEPTCTEPGSTVGLICAECGEVLIATTVIPALGHHFVDGVCDRCGAIYMIGDVNGDGMVNSLDGLILMRYLNGWNVKVAVPEAMDVNCDGKVNSLDGLILIRYLNGWNVTLG